MHYPRTAFAINSSGVTITPTQNASAFIGQRVQLSPADILGIQRFYGCIPTSTSTTTTTTTATTATTTTATTATSGRSTGALNTIPSHLGIYLICLVSIIYFSNKVY
jgi:hypothetical protein